MKMTATRAAATATALGLVALAARSADSRSAMLAADAFEGAWQAAPSMGAGWARAYQIWPDGRIAFHAAQSDCSSRARGWSGRWKQRGAGIAIAIERETRWIGGHEQAPTGSCATPTELVDYQERTVRLKAPRHELLKWRGARASDSDRSSALIGGARFWKFGHAGEYR